MPKLNIAAAFIAGILDGFGWLRVRNWLSDRIDWTGPAIDAFDLSADWFVRSHYGSRPDSVDGIEIDLELDR